MPPLKDVTTGGLIAHIDRAWDTQGEIRQRIAERLPVDPGAGPRDQPHCRSGPVADPCDRRGRRGGLRGCRRCESPAKSAPITLAPRQAILGGETDVLVVGGGQAGLGAALGAAAAGARVILAERYGFLGGNATAALVMPWMSFHTQSPAIQAGKTRLMPGDHGPGEPVVAGAVRTFLERLVAGRRGDPSLPGDRLHRPLRSGDLQARGARPARRGRRSVSAAFAGDGRRRGGTGPAGRLRDEVRTGRHLGPCRRGLHGRRRRGRPRRCGVRESAGRKMAWCSR